MAKSRRTGMAKTIGLVFEAPRGQRINNGFIGVTIFDGRDLWWDYARRKWVPLNETAGRAGSISPCRTLRAFQRHLRKHADALCGREVVLVSRFAGHNITRPSTTTN